jgi:hypothetical protein
MSEPPSDKLLPPPAEIRPQGSYRRLGIALAVALVAIAAVLTAPLWAPSLISLLPWGAAAMGPDPALLQRIERLEAAAEQSRQTAGQQGSALDQLGRRVAGAETKQAEQQQTAAKAASATQQLETRIGALEAAHAREQQNASDTGTKVNQLDKRTAALETKPDGSGKELAELRQQVEKLSAAGADLAAKVAALEKSTPAKSATDPTDTGLLLALLQIRDAVETARPFAAEYDALTALARNRPEIAEAAAPLAEAAKTGVASRAVLAKRLHEVAAIIANAAASPPESDWGSEALARLRGLVTIRRIGSGRRSEPEAAVNAAENNLAAGDLAAAVGALDRLGGVPGEAARPWLQMARQRLAVENALRRVEASLTARLGKGADPIAASPPPG